MTGATQAFLSTAGLFGLSFLAIFVLWIADRLRSDFLKEAIARTYTTRTR
jgi:hypothetical protein